MKLANRIGAAVLATAMVGTLLTVEAPPLRLPPQVTVLPLPPRRNLPAMGTTPTPCLCVLPTWTGSRN